MSPDPRVAPLEDALNAFMDKLKVYAETLGWEDLPHFYNERATLSIFAAACWHVGLIGLEEHVTTKGQGPAERHGRCDFWASSAETSWSFEAKQCFPARGTRNSTFYGVLGEAAQAARENNGPGLHVGLTFFTPSVPNGTSRGDVKHLLDRMRSVASQRGCHGSAWWFPEELMHLPSPTRRDESVINLWPGLLTIVEVVKPGNIETIPFFEID